MSNSLSIGVAQIPNSVSLESNFDAIRKCLDLFEKENVNVVLFPECSLSGCAASMKECTLDVLQPYVDQLASWSRRTGIQVVVPTGLFEKGGVYNSGFWFSRNGVERFYKIGLTDSEKKFFSPPPSTHLNRVFEVNGFRCALIICFEAQHGPWDYFKENSADLILWPGYWGWKLDEPWGPESKETPNEIFENMKSWKIPLIQSTFCFNDLPGYKGAGPEGMSMVVDSQNRQAFQGRRCEVGGFVIHLSKSSDGIQINDCRHLNL